MPRPPKKGRDFERYALLATFVLIVVALVVRDRVFAPDDAAPSADSADVLRVVLGGPDAEIETSGARSPPPLPAVIGNNGTPLPPPTPAILPAEEPDPPPPAAPARTYVVKPGETLSQIAMRELGTVRRASEIARLNGITNPNRVRAGQKLKLPPE